MSVCCAVIGQLDGYQLLCGVSYLISYLPCTDPEAELQQQHGRAALPLPVSARIRGVPAPEQQGDSPVWQKQCARAAGKCLRAGERSHVQTKQQNLNATGSTSVSVAEGRHGGRSRLSLPPPER